MADIFQFDENQHRRSPLCTACEEMLADALDQTLSPADQAWFDTHIAGCVECSEMLADAQSGAAWLELLKSPRPEPSGALMERILAQTNGASAGDLQQEAIGPVIVGQPAILPVAAPASTRSNLLGFRPRLPRFGGWADAGSQPRLAMTAAMAFFSIALTLNLTGVRLDQFHASDLNPANVRRTYYQASAEAVRYYDNLRVVRVMESRVDDLRDTDSESGVPRDHDRPAPVVPEQKPESKPAEKSAPKPAHKDPNGPVSQRQNIFDRPRFMPVDEKSNAMRFAREGGLV